MKIGKAIEKKTKNVDTRLIFSHIVGIFGQKERLWKVAIWTSSMMKIGKAIEKKRKRMEPHILIRKYNESISIKKKTYLISYFIQVFFQTLSSFHVFFVITQNHSTLSKSPTASVRNGDICRASRGSFYLCTTKQKQNYTK